MYKSLDEIPALGEELYNSVSAALESIAFLSVEKYGEQVLEEGGEYINGNIWIKTELAMYSVELYVQVELLESVAIDITVPGTQSELGGNIVIDVLLELVNTIAGSLMRNLETIVGHFTLELPEFEIGKPANKDAFLTEKYAIDGAYPLVVAITKI